VQRLDDPLRGRFERERAERIRDDIQKRVGPDGWSVAVHESKGVYSVELDHELSMPFSFSLGGDAHLDERRLQVLLANPEFQRIRSRPSILTHGPFLGHLRKMAGARRWDREDFAVMARALGTYGLLPHAEAEWLERVGPAWQA
jgi:hypothetical protein